MAKATDEMTTAQKQIMKDLGSHLRHKIVQDIDDYLDLCEVAGIKYRPITGELFSMLADLTTTYAVGQFNIEANEFCKYMGLLFLAIKTREAIKDREDEQAGT